MMEKVAGLFDTAFGGVVNIFNRMTSAIPGAADLMLVGFTIVIVVGLLLLPLRGGGVGRSDRAKKSKNNGSGGDG